MATTLKTPGVYIQEISAFPNAVVGVPTAVPAFVGYTEFAMNGNLSLLDTPFSISSMVEYNQYFGGAPSIEYGISTTPPYSGASPDFTYDNTKYYMGPTSGNFLLYSSINHFFQNGGGTCYIVSVGTYGMTQQALTSPLYSAVNVLNQLNVDTQALVKGSKPPASSSSSSSSSSGTSGESPASKSLRGLLNNVLNDGTIYMGTLSGSAPASSSSSSSGSAGTSFNGILGMVQATVTNPAITGTGDVNNKANMNAAWSVLSTGGTSILAALNSLKAASASTELNFTTVNTAANALNAALTTALAFTPTPSVTPPATAQAAVTQVTAATILRNAVVDIYAPSLTVDVSELTAGIDLLINEQEPTMLVIPDSMSPDVKDADAYSLQQAMLAHCNKMQSRIALLDVRSGWRSRKDQLGDPVQNFRDAIGINNVEWGASYYPWLNTTVWQSNDIDYTYISDTTSNAGIATLQSILNSEVTAALMNGSITQSAATNMSQQITQLSYMDGSVNISTLNNTILGFSSRYNDIMNTLLFKINQLPTTPAMAGIYNYVDNQVGVWKAPANVSVSSVTSPAVTINDDDQQDLNAPLDGKSVNAIRSFVGEGVLVWGARTLDANSLDWRYINVRRTMIFLEQSIKIAAKAYVFQPNVANTWVSIQSMISNFLNSQWKAGALAGASPADAYSVLIGLGSTMTADDILNGIMNITVLVAVSHPAEFIVITFQQQMQKS